MKIPEAENSIPNLIDRYHERQTERRRHYFGLSGVGGYCERRMWYEYRWSVRQKLSGRIKRLFRRGHREEEIVIEDLRAIGLVITGEQAQIELPWGIRGHADGIVESGVPGAPKTRHVLEIKTHNRKSFDALDREGVERSKPEHWAQMQAYMHGLGIDRALYVAVCKDDDRMYTERVRFDSEAAKRLISRAERIVRAETPPPPISTDPTWYQCKFCPAHGICHAGEPTTETNCRTCVHSTMREDGALYCERWRTVPPREVIEAGCDSHVVRPQLVPWELDPQESTETAAAYIIDGVTVMQGEDHLSLADVLAGARSDDVARVRRVFEGEVIR